MNQRGQLLIVIAIVISIALLLLAVAVDAGRLFMERNRMERAAQAAADAGVGVAAEKMVELAEVRREEARQERQEGQEGEGGEESPGEEAEFEPCEPEPQCWLEREDWEALNSSAIRSEVEREALKYARLNGFGRDDAEILALRVEYEVLIGRESLQVNVKIRRRASVLLVGLLGKSFVELEAEGLSTLFNR